MDAPNLEEAKLDRSAKSYDTPLTKEESLVCEALVREIGRADRWSAVMDGWEALLHVRHMASAMHIEARMFDEGRTTRSAPEGHGCGSAN
ncbi:hypothetical protein LCGC14_2919720 [marine sediment metagenome]|uniref:Uncharacterized protein n=1 Tax=marine sediment metagenome TaxID=412755 RepID=A0A0F8YB43_9ZZZZ